MRGLRGVAAMVALFLVALSMAPVGRAAGASKPEWSVGDFWLHEGTLIIGSEYLFSSIRTQVVAVEGPEATGLNHATYRLAVNHELSYSPGLIGTATAYNETSWIRVSDLALSRTRFEEVANSTVTFDPPVEFYFWRLQENTSWTGASTLRQASGPSPLFNYTVSVGVASTLQVTAGTFDTYPIRMDPPWPFGGFQVVRDHYAPAVGFYVRREIRQEFAPGFEIFGNLDLKEYSYRGPAPPPPDLWLIIALFAMGISIPVVILVWRRRRRPPDPAGPAPG